MSKKKILGSYSEVLSKLKEILQEDVMLAISDREKIISYVPDDKDLLQIKVGQTLKIGEPLQQAVESNKIVKMIVPKEIHGTAFKAVGYPIRNKKGECIGAVGYGKSLEKEDILDSSLRKIVDSFVLVNEQMQSTVDGVFEINDIIQDASASSVESFSSIKEVTLSSEDVEQIAEEAKDLSANVKVKAERGTELVTNIVTKVQSISVSSQEVVEKINALNNSIKKIDSMLDLINQISEQTNLLALNASIEAARAGDSGRGFAVVADEVGKLAVQSKSATVEISEVVKSVLDEINDVIHSVQKSSSVVDEGVKTAEETSSNILSIIESIIKVDHIVSKVSTKSKAQRKTTEHISTAIENLTNVIEKTAITVNGVGKTIEEQVEKINIHKDEMMDISEKLIYDKGNVSIL